MSKVGRHQYLPAVMERPRKQYYEKLEAEVVTFNLPNLFASVNSVSNNNKQSSNELIRKPHLYLAWLPPNDTSTSLEIQTTVTSLRDAAKYPVYFPVYPYPESLPLFRSNLTHPEIFLPRKILRVTDVHTLFLKLPLQPKIRQPEKSESTDKYQQTFTKYELKQIWFSLKSKELFWKLMVFNKWRSSTNIHENLVHSLHWMFKHYTTLHCLIESFCYVEQFDSTSAERIAQCCQKMNTELLRRIQICQNTEMTMDEMKELLNKWNASNSWYLRSELFRNIFIKSYNIINKWDTCIPEWVQEMFTQVEGNKKAKENEERSNNKEEEKRSNNEEEEERSNHEEEEERSNHEEEEERLNGREEERSNHEKEEERLNGREEERSNHEEEEERLNGKEEERSIHEEEEKRLNGREEERSNEKDEIIEENAEEDEEESAEEEIIVVKRKIKNNKKKERVKRRKISLENIMEREDDEKENEYDGKDNK